MLHLFHYYLYMLHMIILLLVSVHFHYTSNYYNFMSLLSSPLLLSMFNLSLLSHSCYLHLYFHSLLLLFVVSLYYFMHSSDFMHSYMLYYDYLLFITLLFHMSHLLLMPFNHILYSDLSLSLLLLSSLSLSSLIHNPS